MLSIYRRPGYLKVRAKVNIESFPSAFMGMGGVRVSLSKGLDGKNEQKTEQLHTSLHTVRSLVGAVMHA